MENEGNSLLELPLETVEILEEVHIPSNHVGNVSDTHVDNVGEMLIDEGTQSGISGMESNSIDFEFVNTDLGTGSDFNIDNSSVFGMTENGMDVREDCEYLFRDSSCFYDSNTCVSKQIDSGTLTQSGMISIPNSGKLNLYKDLGLKLQVIPLNNLQYVSTIQTSKGLHILAIPSQASLPSNCDDITIQQLCQKLKVNSPELSLNQCLESRLQTKSPSSKVNSSETLSKVKAKTIMKSRISVKDSFLSKSSRKLRNSVNKKLIICRNDSHRKGCVQSMFNNNSLVNQRKDVKGLVDVIKSKNIKKHRMVSILNKSVTSKLKQTQYVMNSNTNKEIKVTFHLKPPLGSEKERTAGGICTKSNSDIFKIKTNENQEEFEIDGLKTHQIGQDLAGDNNRKTLRISESDQIFVSEENALSKSAHTCISNKKRAFDKIKLDKAVEEKGKVNYLGLDRMEQIQAPENCKKILKYGAISAENKSVGKRFQCKTCLTSFLRQGHLKNHMKTHLEILTELKHVPEAFTNNDKSDSKLFPEEGLTIKEKVSVYKDGRLEKETPRISTGNEISQLSSEKEMPHLSKEKEIQLPTEKEIFQLPREKEIPHDSNADSGKKINNISSNVLTCEFCGMSFKTPGNLTRHKLTHSMNVDRKVDPNITLLHFMYIVFYQLLSYFFECC
jgi:hypothetical protein